MNSRGRCINTVYYVTDKYIYIQPFYVDVLWPLTDNVSDEVWLAPSIPIEAAEFWKTQGDKER